MRVVLIFIYVFLTLGCSTRHQINPTVPVNEEYFYKAIVETTKSYNDTSTTAKVLLELGGFNPTKEIFARLSSELEDSKSVAYLFTWENDLATVTLRFSAIVHDYIRNKRYYIANTEGTRNFEVVTEEPSSFAQHSFVLLQLENKNLEELRKWQFQFSSAEMGQDYEFYKLHKLSSKSNLIYLSSVAVQI